MMFSGLTALCACSLSNELAHSIPGITSGDGHFYVIASYFACAKKVGVIYKINS